MQININNEFIKAVTIGSSMAGVNKTLPILDHVKITFKQNKIIVSSFDTNNAITKVYEDKTNQNENNTTFCVNKTDFLSVLSALVNEVVDIIINETNVQIKHSNGVITLPVANAEQYPTPNVDKELKSFTVSSEEILDILGEARNFVGNDEIRPVMTGVRLLFEDNTMTVSATDAHVLYNNKVANSMTEDKSECIIPSGIIPTLMNILKDTDNATINIGQSNVIVKTDDCKVVIRAIEGRYPNVMAVIPKEHSTTVNISKKDFVKTINRIMITASKATAMMKFDIGNGKLSVEAEDLDFAKSSKEEIQADIQGKDIVIGLNGRMLKTCIDAIESDNITLELSAPNRAVVLRDSANSEKTVLVMPINIG